MREFVSNPNEKFHEIKIEKSSLSIPDYYLTGLLRELIENTVKYSCQNTPIKISGKIINGGKYKLLFRNMNNKFTWVQIKQINLFEQFRNEDKAKNGSGIGLFIVRKIAELVGGNFEIRKNKENYIDSTVTLNV